MKREDIRSWMRARVRDHVDGRTGEVDCTGLVEAWDVECDDGGATLDPDHIAWFVAFEVSEEAKRN